MIRIDNTSKNISVKLEGAITTAELDFNASWDDISYGPNAMTPGSDSGLTVGATQVVIVPSPAASTYRNIKYLSVYNSDTVAHTVTISLFNGTSYFVLMQAKLQPGYTLVYNDGYSWSVFSDTGEQGADTTGLSGFSGQSGLSGNSTSGFSGHSGIGISGLSGFSGNEAGILAMIINSLGL